MIVFILIVYVVIIIFINIFCSRAPIKNKKFIKGGEDSILDNLTQLKITNLTFNYIDLLKNS